MVKLSDRLREIPYGFKFKLPEAKWEAPPHMSFDAVVSGAMRVAEGNPELARASKWPTTREGWENAVDFYNASLCKAHRWNGFYIEVPGVPAPEGGPIPKAQSPLQFAGRAVAGASVLGEMFGKDGPESDRELVERRAKTCVACPKNDKGDWTRWFTQPAQALIIKALGAVKDLDLTTSVDSELHVCVACGCPLKGKVWARLPHILAHIPAEDKAALDPGCWILNEPTWKTISTPDEMLGPVHVDLDHTPATDHAPA